MLASLFLALFKRPLGCRNNGELLNCCLNPKAPCSNDSDAFFGPVLLHFPVPSLQLTSCQEKKAFEPNRIAIQSRQEL